MSTTKSANISSLKPTATTINTSSGGVSGTKNNGIGRGFTTEGSNRTGYTTLSHSPSPSSSAAMSPPSLAQQLRQPSPGDKVITCTLLILFFLNVFFVITTFAFTIKVWGTVGDIHEQLKVGDNNGGGGV
jgi:hypothetical protein